MSQNSFTAPLSLSIKSSFQKWMIVLIPHLLFVILVLFFNLFNYKIMFVLVALIVASFVYYSRLHLFQNSKHSVMSIYQDSAKNWSFTSNKSNKNGEKMSATLLPSSFISKVLIVLNYRDSVRRKHSIIITPDSLSNNEFRRLRVRLNFFNSKKN